MNEWIDKVLKVLKVLQLHDWWLDWRIGYSVKRELPYPYRRKDGLLWVDGGWWVIRYESLTSLTSLHSLHSVQRVQCIMPSLGYDIASHRMTRTKKKTNFETRIRQFILIRLLWLTNELTSTVRSIEQMTYPYCTVLLSVQRCSDANLFTHSFVYFAIFVNLWTFSKVWNLWGFLSLLSLSLSLFVYLCWFCWVIYLFALKSMKRRQELRWKGGFRSRWFATLEECVRDDVCTVCT